MDRRDSKKGEICLRIRTLCGKMMVFLGTLCLFSILLVAAAGLWVTGRSLEEDLKQTAVENALNGVRLLEKYQAQALGGVRNIAANPLLAEAMKEEDFDKLKKVTVELMKNGALEYLVATDPTGRVLIRAHEPGKVPAADDNISNQENIRRALLGEPFVGMEEGRVVKLSVRAGAPVRDSEGALVGAVSAGFVASQDSMVDEAKALFRGEYSIFLGAERVASTVIDGGKRARGDLAGGEALLKGLTGPTLGEDPLLGDSHVTAFAPLVGAKGTVTGMVSVSMSRDGIVAARGANGKTVALVTAAVLASALILGAFFARAIARPIMNLRGLMTAVGAGDLTVYGEITVDDEMSELTATFNQMVQRQSDTLEKVRKSAEELARSSEEIASSASEVTAMAEGAAASVTEVSELAEKGSGASLESNQVLLELASLIQMAQQKGKNAQATSDRTLETATEGRDTVLHAVEAMGKIKELTAETEARMETLDDYAKQITTITDTITGIARQTNLLALNAAIEAARAGDAGRGFAVVADEVRILAEQSNKGAEEVAQLVARIAENTSAAMEGIRGSTVEVERGVEVVNGAGQALNHILSATESTKMAVDSIVSITDEEVASSDKIISLIASINEVMTNTAKRADEVAAATEETMASMETIGAGTEEVTSMSTVLLDEVRTFKIQSQEGVKLSDDEYIRKSKSDHLLWKVRISNMIHGLDSVAPETVNAHHECRLGHWYFSPDNPFTGDPDYKKMDEPHREVHESARAAAEAYAKGDVREAKRMLGKLEKSSRAVIRGLDSLLKKVR